MADNDDRHYLPPSEAAKLLMVSPITVRAWVQKGLLPSGTTPGGRRRFLRGDIDQFAKNRKTPPARSVQASPALQAELALPNTEDFLLGYLLSMPVRKLVFPSHWIKPGCLIC